MMIAPRRNLRICDEVGSEIEPEPEPELAVVVSGGRMAGLIYPPSSWNRRRYDGGGYAVAGRA